MIESLINVKNPISFTYDSENDETIFYDTNTDLVLFMCKGEPVFNILIGNELDKYFEEV